MQLFLTGLANDSLPLLISAAIMAAAVVVALLGNTGRSVSGHVYRIGRKPARMELPHAHGRVAVSVRTIDKDHVWMRIDAPTDTEVRVEGDGEPARDLRRPTERDRTR